VKVELKCVPKCAQYLVLTDLVKEYKYITVALICIQMQLQVHLHIEQVWYLSDFSAGASST
jgi:hypothetical protein